MAKGVEDTAFYRYHRLLALNEVGGDPSRFGTSVAEFHQACQKTQASAPWTLLAATTHDTKRSEDVRARLALLSEIPRRWAEALRRWAGLNARHRHADLPDRNTEYLIYQTLVGAWPLTRERLTAYLTKAVREAKLHTSWTQPDERYEQGVLDFATAILEDAEFRRDLEAFVDPLVHPGRINSLAQTLLRLTAPGVPDIYQGTELWDLSLVDPDNRRPVDFQLRRDLLAATAHASCEEILARMDEGLPKLWVMRQALRLRRRRAACFGPQGSYRPLEVRGARAAHVVALLRGDEVAAVAPRLLLGLDGDWTGTELQLPPGDWRNLLTGDAASGGAVELAGILAQFPVALFEREG
jgi:(1->4)-alpha-D-glucan 1-alpha-D-glucosylmutase